MEKHTESSYSISQGARLNGKRDEHADHLVERHFSVAELSELWNLSRDSIRRLFENEPGVVIFKKSKPHKRIYKTLRIPESVAMRVYRMNMVIKF